MGRKEEAKIDYSKAIEIYSQLFEEYINRGIYTIYLIGDIIIDWIVSKY